MNYCSDCGSPDISLAIPAGDTFQRFVCKNCGRIFYDNPRVIVGCLATYEDKVLLCKRAIEPQSGLWNLPAGFLENGEKAEEGAFRETFEETNTKVEIVKLHALYSLPMVNQVYLHFLAKIITPDFGPTKESLEVKLFDQKDIPWDDIAFHSTTFALEKYFSSKDFEGVHIGSLDTKESWH